MGQWRKDRRSGQKDARRGIPVRHPEKRMRKMLSKEAARALRREEKHARRAAIREAADATISELKEGNECRNEGIFVN